jgi:hypothetical protein
VSFLFSIVGQLFNSERISRAAASFHCSYDRAKVLLPIPQNANIRIADIVVPVASSINAHHISSIQVTRQTPGHVNIENSTIDANIDSIITMKSLCHDARKSMVGTIIIGTICAITVLGIARAIPLRAIPSVPIADPPGVVMSAPIPF